MAYTRLGDLLISTGVITEEQLHKALEIQKTTVNKRLGQVLIDEKIIREMQLIEALQLQLGIDFVDLSKEDIPAEMTQVLPKSLAIKYSVVPVKTKGDELYLAMTDPLNFIAIEEAKSVTKKRVIPMIATIAATERAISILYGNEGVKRAIEDLEKESAEDGVLVIGSGISQIGDEDSLSAPTIRLVNSIIERAVNMRASDIHIEPRENEMAVRMRVDGIMHNVLNVPRAVQASVVSRVKIMCGMDITERRVPQDGRASVIVKMKELDLRTSTLPTVYGEKVVLRLLDRDAQILNASGLGLEGDNLEKFEKLMTNRQGVVLIVGPTGSGKSSTMYTMIDKLNTEEVNLVTLEDPVEYQMDGVNQVQINEKIGMSFASGLKSILRQDPDIIAIGEIRDGETAEIAMRAAITGHLVLSTVHTSDAISTLDRLVDIGVEPYMITSALKGVISQRLVRRICPHCREGYTPSIEELEMIDMADADPHELTFYRGVGCPECFGSGYRGRTAVFEILVITRDIRRAIHDRASTEKLMEAVEASGFSSLLENCRKLVLEGVTTVQESYRVISVTD